jgi:hypothetical protein
MQWLGVGNFPFDRNLTRQLNPTPSSSEWWMSLTLSRLNWGNDPANNTFIVGGFVDGGGSGLQLGYDDAAGDGVPDIVLRSGGINYQIEADAPANSTRYLLVKLDVNAGGNDTVSIWNSPADVLSLGGADVVFNSFDVTSSLTPFTQSKYESPGQSGVAYFDEILLGTTLTSIIPEPTTMSLLLLGVGGLLAVRRRKA